MDGVSMESAYLLIFIMLTHLLMKLLGKSVSRICHMTDHIRSRASISEIFYNSWPFPFYWIMISAALAYVGTAVTISLCLPPSPRLPFKTFYELAKKTVAGELNVIFMYDVDKSSIFPPKHPNNGMVARLFAEANERNPPKVMPMEQAIKAVISSSTNVFIVAGYAESRKIQQQYCHSVILIEDVDQELPVDQSSVYYSHQFYHRLKTPHSELLGWHQRQIIARGYQKWVDWYTSESSECDMEVKPQNHAAPLAFAQLRTLFFYSFCSYIICIVVFTLEIIFTFLKRSM